MLERNFRIPKSVWAFQNIDPNVESLNVAIKRGLASAYGDTDISWGRILKSVEDGARKVIDERLSMGDEFPDPGRSDLEVNLSLGEGSGKLRVGVFSWVQPRPRV